MRLKAEAARRVLEEHRRALSQRVLATIRCRFEQGRYGRCVECDDPIAPARLRALPFALRCLACEIEREKRASHATKRGGELSRLTTFDPDDLPDHGA